MKVPSLPDHPPNFVVASELRAHVTPVAVVPTLWTKASVNLPFMKVPSLPDHPPNFLVVSELRAHVTPITVVPDLVDNSISNNLMIISLS
jgi:hypothetical protein